MIRAFVGVRIDPSMVEKILEAQTQLKRSLTGIRWVSGANLHFTLKFLGPIAEEKISPATAALEKEVHSITPFSITGRGIGVFPDIGRARVLWVGLKGEALVCLAEVVETALDAVGFAREKRSFEPHLTIGRWRDSSHRIGRLRQEMEQWKEYDFGVSSVKEVVLFQSVLRPEGAVYSPLRTISLGH